MEKKLMLYQSLNEIRHKLDQMELKKTGHNKHSNYNYYQLSDFQPQIQKLNFEYNIGYRFFITKDKAILEVRNETEKETWFLPFEMFPKLKMMNEIQSLGSFNTYYKKYLLMNAYGISDNDFIDESNTSGEKTEEQLTIEAAREFTNSCVRRGKDAKFAKDFAKYLGLGAKTTKEEWAITTSQLDVLLKAYAETF